MFQGQKKEKMEKVLACNAMLCTHTLTHTKLYSLCPKRLIFSVTDFSYKAQHAL